jgi:hypothetical protein
MIAMVLAELQVTEMVEEVSRFVATTLNTTNLIDWDSHGIAIRTCFSPCVHLTKLVHDMALRSKKSGARE